MTTIAFAVKSKSPTFDSGAAPTMQVPRACKYDYRNWTILSIGLESPPIRPFEQAVLNQWKCEVQEDPPIDLFRNPTR